MIRSTLIVVAACIPAWACAQQQPEPLEASRTKQATATIQAVSQSDRHLVLLTEEGERVLVEAPADVTGFDRIKPGDQVVVTYQEGVIVEAKPPGEGTPGTTASAAAGRTEPGEAPTKAAGMTIATTVEIESVDTENNKVTFKPSDGVSRTLAVESPEAQEFVSRLQPGDKVQVTYREAAAVSIQPPRG